MATISLYQEMRQKTGPLWEDIFAHPFVRGIGDGSLSRDRFEYLFFDMSWKKEEWPEGQRG